MRTLLPTLGPYDGARLLAFLGAHAVPGVEAWDGVTYARSLLTPSGPAVVTAALGGAGVEVAVEGPVGAHDPGRSALTHLLTTTESTLAAETALGADPVVGPSVRARPGLRVPGSVDHPETLVRTVVGQQVSLAGARTVLGRVVAEHGRALPADLRRAGVTTLFPTMTALAACDPAGLPMPRARGRAVVAAARACSGAGAGQHLPDRDVLLALPGVGPWTADYVDLRCRRDPDVFLPTDLAVRRVLEARGLDAGASAAAARATGWAPYRSTALIHLWTGYLERSPS